MGEGRVHRPLRKKGRDLTMRKCKKVSEAEILAAVEADDNLGFCLACGAEAEGVEPDASKFPCGGCGERKVFGAEQLMFLLGYGN